MSYNLVIVESASKGKTIEKYLNSISELSNLGTFKVTACFGHIRDLPKKELGIDTETWIVKYELLNKSSILNKLKSLAKDAKKVYIASDMDLEGNAIAFHLRYFLKLKRENYERVVFNEITKKALKEAFMNGGDIDMNQVYAQETRRVLDRLVGYKLSPLLWSNFNNNFLSAGRVQSVALKLIIDRTNIVKNHNYEMYWTCKSDFKYKTKNIELILSASEYINGSLMKYNNNSDTIKFLDLIKDLKKWNIIFKISNVYRNPPSCFTTSLLQQESYTKYHYSPKLTMSIAQDLYESGFITYMRTDSVNLSKDAQNSILNYIKQTYGENYSQFRTFKNKNMNAQEAHEAIRPSDIKLTPELFENNSKSKNHSLLYELIWKRTIASQMSPAKYIEVNYNITHSNINSDRIFIGNISTLKELGYLIIYNTEIDENKVSFWENFNSEDKYDLNPDKIEMLSELTQPKPLFDDASIVKTLEKEGIGRPSTYVTIIEKLYNKNYIIKGNLEVKKIESSNYIWESKNKTIKTKKHTIKINNNEKKMISTELGENIIKYLSDIYPDLLLPKLTSDIEEYLDEIAENKINKIEVLNRFYIPFEKMLKNIENKQTSYQKPKDIKEFPQLKNINYINTKYGPALVETKSDDTKKYYSVNSYLSWKKIKDTDLSQKDAEFIMSLPKKIGSKEIHMGQYGLYIKNNGKNEKLDKKLWDKVYNNTITENDIN